MIRTMGAGRITFGIGTAALPLFAYGERWWQLGVMMLGIAIWTPGHPRRVKRRGTPDGGSTGHV